MNVTDPRNCVLQCHKIPYNNNVFASSHRHPSTNNIQLSEQISTLGKTITIENTRSPLQCISEMYCPNVNNKTSTTENTNSHRQ